MPVTAAHCFALNAEYFVLSGLSSESNVVIQRFLGTFSGSVPRTGGIVTVEEGCMFLGDGSCLKVTWRAAMLFDLRKVTGFLSNQTINMLS